MGATVVFEKHRGKWYLLDRVDGRRKKTVLGPDEADRERGEKAARLINERRENDRLAAHRIRAVGANGDDALTAWWAAARPGFADSTRRTVGGYVRLHLRPFFGPRDLERLTAEDVKRFAARSVEAGLGQHAVAGALSVLRRVLRWLVEQDLLERMPVGRIVQIGVAAAAARGAQRGERDAYTKPEAAQILGLCSGRLYEVVFAACQTGARKGELLGLRWQSIDFARKEITWRESRWHDTVKPTKANRVRRSAMSLELAKLLTHLREDREPGPRENVFIDRSGKPWKYDSLGSALRRLRQRAIARGARVLEFHAWRHTFVSWALAGGADPLWVAAQIGDRPETMLRTYAHLIRGQTQDLGFLSISQGAASRSRPRQGRAARGSDVGSRPAPPAG